MVQFHRSLWRTQVDDCEEPICSFVCPNVSKPKTRSKLANLFVLCFIFLSFNLLHSSFHPFYSIGWPRERILAPLCSSISNGSICCDRTSRRFDVCFMKGDLRTNSSSSSIRLYSEHGGLQVEKLKPYPRKWENDTMATVAELSLVIAKEDDTDSHVCHVSYDVPAVVFSTSGYTGNLYHEFNDGIVPLYITSERFHKKVVFVIQEYHAWWMTKYSDILSQLSDFPVLDFSSDRRTHCFNDAIVGLKVHDDLAVDSSLMEDSKTILDFRNMLDEAYSPRIKWLIEEEKKGDVAERKTKPKLVIISRNGSREILNEKKLVKLAEKIGFEVETLRPDRTTELAKVYRSLNSSDVLVGVHGAALTHFLFMRPGSVFVQVVPLGLEWASENYYGGPAKKMGLNYTAYRILPEESSLFDDYDRNNSVLNDPQSVNDRGWAYTKSIYLDRQNIRLNLKRIRTVLVRAYKLAVHRKVTV